MSRSRVRPTFVRPLSVEPSMFFASLANALARADGRCRGHMLADGAILRMRSAERHVWSPALYLHVEPDGRGGDALHGKFSPSSPVWTAFVAIYIGLACVTIAAGCYGVAQMTLDQTPWALIGVPVALALAGFTYGAAFIGQGLGAEDMYELRSFVDRVADSM